MKKHQKAERTYAAVPVEETRGGPGSAGQSGDTQGLPGIAEAGPESVRELVEEGQYFEAEVLLGVETAEDPDVAEVQTSELPDEDLSLERAARDLSTQRPSSHKKPV
jgi:hypothetical protein